MRFRALIHRGSVLLFCRFGRRAQWLSMTVSVADLDPEA